MFAGFLLLVLGCSEPGAGPAPINVDLSTWQRGVEHYIDEQGNGDPNVLRDTTLPTAQSGFAMIGQPDVTRSSDADGLLLGHRYINGRPWFIFLVGLIKEGELDDIRFVALSHEVNRNIWQVSDPDPSAVGAYRKSAEASNAPYIMFPSANDQFTIEIASPTVVVQHVSSGANWHLDLGAK